VGDDDEIGKSAEPHPSTLAARRLRGLARADDLDDRGGEVLARPVSSREGSVWATGRGPMARKDVPTAVRGCELLRTSASRCAVLTSSVDPDCRQRLWSRSLGHELHLRVVR
jgi:hypothetical protein